MKFIADVMLGRLAKRLRLLGFDVLYDRALDDNEILRLSLAQDRVILTRDLALSARPLASNHLLIKSEAVQEQAEQVLTAFHLKALVAPLSRCSVCNETLKSITKQDAHNLVPVHIYDNNSNFLSSPKCGRIYWKGTHVRRMAIKAPIAMEKTL
jgi:uncharacterized protein with PIN domain